MTKPQTMKEEILAEFDKLFIPENQQGDISMERYLSILRGQKQFLFQTITRVVESVPCVARLAGESNTDRSVNDEIFFSDGYNQHVEEIHHWKQQWLGEEEAK